MAESVGETPPPYTLPTPLELQNAVQNTIASPETGKPHYIFVETVMMVNNLTIYVHRHPSNGRYLTHPKFNHESTAAKSNHHIFSFAQNLHIANIMDFTSYQELVNQILPCVVCPENKAADVRLSHFVGVAEMEVSWKGEGMNGMPNVKISGRGEEHARRVMGMVEQRGWKDVIRVKFIPVAR